MNKSSRASEILKIEARIRFKIESQTCFSETFCNITNLVTMSKIMSQSFGCNVLIYLCTNISFFIQGIESYTINTVILLYYHSSVSLLLDTLRDYFQYHSFFNKRGATTIASRSSLFDRASTRFTRAKKIHVRMYFIVTNTHDDIRSESPVGWWVSQAAAMSSPTPSPTAQSHQPNHSCMDEASHLLNRILPRYVTPITCRNSTHYNAIFALLLKKNKKFVKVFKLQYINYRTSRT